VYLTPLRLILADLIRLSLLKGEGRVRVYDLTSVLFQNPSPQSCPLAARREAGGHERTLSERAYESDFRRTTLAFRQMISVI
jgi:hypothetical protein